MSLKEILQTLARDGNPKLLDSNRAAIQADELLTTLPERTLMRKAHLVTNLYIAEINEAGYMGSILYRFV
jgi:hypothetical protein